MTPKPPLSLWLPVRYPGPPEPIPDGWATSDMPFATPGDFSRQIMTDVAERHGLTLHDMISGGRQRRFAWARQEAMAELRDHTELSFPQIAAKLRLTDHTAVIYGIKRHKKRDRNEA